RRATACDSGSSTLAMPAFAGRGGTSRSFGSEPGDTRRIIARRVKRRLGPTKNPFSRPFHASDNTMTARWRNTVPYPTPEIPSSKTPAPDFKSRGTGSETMHLALNFQRVEPARGGTETYVALLCRHLVEAGHRVDLYAERWSYQCVPPGVNLVRVAAPG